MKHKSVISCFLSIIFLILFSVPCFATEPTTDWVEEMVTGHVEIPSFEQTSFDESDLVNVEFRAKIDPNINPMYFLIYVFDKNDKQYGYYFLERGNHYVGHGAIPRGEGYEIKYIEIQEGFEDRLSFTPVKFNATDTFNVIEFDVGDPTQELVTRATEKEDGEESSSNVGENVTTPSSDRPVDEESTTSPDVVVSKPSANTATPEKIEKTFISSAFIIGGIPVIIFIVCVIAVAVFIIKKRREE